MPGPRGRQAERLQEVFAELVRGYQFRDRESICCHGVSISQCYALDSLERQGPATMSELAGRMSLELSTMTRIVDRLVDGKLATRAADPEDRRVCCVKITRQGRALVARIRAELVEEHEQVLREIPPESREAVISAVGHLLAAFRQRQQRLCGKRRRRAG
ncbi:MAG: MarR family winged helix-turn-helix transcriptional regulator [Planctomycetota bacterium]|jgi:DNA-binding MarR family transcriptional regulator